MQTQKFSKYSGIKLSKVSGVSLGNAETEWIWGYLGPNVLLSTSDKK